MACSLSSLLDLSNLRGKGKGGEGGLVLTEFDKLGVIPCFSIDGVATSSALDVAGSTSKGRAGAMSLAFLFFGDRSCPSNSRPLLVITTEALSKFP